MTERITCSAPVASIIISPILSSVKKAVPKPVRLPFAANDDIPDINLSLSVATLAVKFSSFVSEAVWPTPLASSTLKLLTAVGVCEAATKSPLPLLDIELPETVLNVPTTSCKNTRFCAETVYATIPVAPVFNWMTLSPGNNSLSSSISKVNIVNILISNRYRFKNSPLCSSMFLTLAKPIWPILILLPEPSYASRVPGVVTAESNNWIGEYASIDEWLPNSGKPCASFTLSLLPNLAGVFAFESDSTVLALFISRLVVPVLSIE